MNQQAQLVLDPLSDWQLVQFLKSWSQRVLLSKCHKVPWFPNRSAFSSRRLNSPRLSVCRSLEAARFIINIKYVQSKYHLPYLKSTAFTTNFCVCYSHVIVSVNLHLSFCILHLPTQRVLSNMKQQSSAQTAAGEPDMPL